LTGSLDDAIADALYLERAANNIFTRAAQARALDAVAGPVHSNLCAQLETLRQEMEAVKAREFAALTEVERLKQEKLEAEMQQRQANSKHTAEVATIKKENADLKHAAQLNKDEAEKRKKDVEAAEHRLKQAEADRKTEAKRLNQKLTESENLRQNATTQHAAELAQLKQQAIAEHSGVVGTLQQQLFQVAQERDEIGQRAVAENAQLRLLRTLPNFWSLLRDAEVLNCPIKSRLEQVPSSVPAQSAPSDTEFPSQESDPEAMEGVEKIAVVPGGNISAGTHQTNNSPFQSHVSAVVDPVRPAKKDRLTPTPYGNGSIVPQNVDQKKMDSASNVILGRNQQTGDR
jgi:myosin heavy subunit